jgi:UDP-N-acetylglucosamine 1-carboxyvinyltransferase
VRISGNKNAVLPMIAATLLTDDEVILNNVPDILDVRTMLDISTSLGAEYDFNNNRLSISNKKVDKHEIPVDLCNKNRTSILFAAPLLARFGKATLYQPGGDVIGRRRIDGHIYGLKTLGASFDKDNSYAFTAENGLHGRELFLDEASVTATEQILMAAVLAKGTTTLYNAACEPHVVDLADLLNKMGAKISGHGGNVITIEGVNSLHGCEHTVVSDHIEGASFISLAVANNSEITIEGVTTRHFWMTRRVFERLGVEIDLQTEHNRIFVPGNQNPAIKKDFDGQIPCISDGTWPQFPSDMMSCAIVAATQIQGTVLFFEKMFESRLYFVDRLIAMGANAIVCDPHRVVISGKSQLCGTTLPSPDIRAGMAMLIAGSCAKGVSTINNINVTYRGYEKLLDKLQSLNVKIYPAK